ncbi:DUF4157 domain-containing protein [Streptomyces galilaeus]
MSQQSRSVVTRRPYAIPSQAAEPPARISGARDPAEVSPWVPAVALPPTVRGALAGDGRPLDAGLRAVAESAFSQDFSAIRIHSGAGAYRAATALCADAFSVGEHIMLGPGVRPDDRRVIGHELAHVVQHRRG